MENLTVVVPFFNGQAYIEDLVASIPNNTKILFVDDVSDRPLQYKKDNVEVIRLQTKGYFTGAVNEGIRRCSTDVLILNQDVVLRGNGWLDLIAEKRREYALIGERIKGDHPAFPFGYPHGVFMFMRRDAIEKAGLLDAEFYPLWGSTAVWQWQCVRQGFKVLPLPEIPGLVHQRGVQPLGSSIRQQLDREPGKRRLLIRTPPEISVIIPAYNHGKFLESAINSLVGGKTDIGVVPPQTFQSFEIIVVNDGSTDDTHERMLDLEDGWRGIRYIRQENAGTSAAHNAGIRQANGRFITCMSADDMREPWALASLYRTSLANPHSLVYDNMQTLVHNNEKGWHRGNQWRLRDDYSFRELLYQNMVPVCTMFEKSAWQQVGGYPEILKHGREDWGFAIAMGRAGYCGVRIEQSGYLYRQHAHNRVKRNTTPEWRNFFLGQMVGLFPDVYRGEFPVACCGGKGASKGKSGAMAMAAMVLPGAEGMTLLEYVGRNVGSSRWGGPETGGRIYVFGNNIRDKRKLVDNRDLAWFMAKQQHGNRLFREANAVPVMEAVEEPVAVQNGGGLEEVVAEEEGLTVDELREMTIAEILDMDLRGRLEEILDLEMKGKGRRTLMRTLKEMIVEERESV